MKEDELFRLAFIYAEQDRVTFLDAWAHVNDKDGLKVQRKTKALIKRLREYRQKRWGKSLGDLLDEIPTKAVIIK